MAIVRRIIGGVIGVIAAGGTIALVEAVGHDTGSGGAAFGTAIAGYGIGCAIGTFATTMIAGRGISLVVPAILAVLAAINLFAFPHPWWFAPAAVGALVAGWLAGRFFAGRLPQRQALADRADQ